MKTFQDFLNEDKSQQIIKAAKEVHDFLFGGGSKAIDMENFTDGVLKDHNLSRSERKMVIARVKNVHGYSGKALDKLLSEATLTEAGQWEEFVDANKGREGKTLLSPQGTEVNKNTFVISVDKAVVVYSKIEGNNIKIVVERYRENDSVTITKAAFDTLKRIV